MRDIANEEAGLDLAREAEVNAFEIHDALRFAENMLHNSACLHGSYDVVCETGEIPALVDAIARVRYALTLTCQDDNCSAGPSIHAAALRMGEIEFDGTYYEYVPRQGLVCRTV